MARRLMARPPSGKRLLRWSRMVALAGAVLALAGCAAQMAYRDGVQLVADDQVEAGLLKYREAIAADPNNAQYRAAFLKTRDRTVIARLEQAERALAAGQGELALRGFQGALAIDPANERARAGLRLVEADARHAALMADASAALARGDDALARQAATAILSERPNHEPARLLLAKASEKKIAMPASDSGLAAAYKLPINIEFRDASLKQVFEVLARRSGLNFLFDKDVKTDQRVSIFLKNSTVEAAVYYLLMSNQLEQQVMDGNTVLVYPSNPAKLKEYQEMTVKTFYLANAEAKNVANTLKTILKARDVAVDDKLNLVIMRDSAEAIRLATRIVALQDVAEPEVMLDVEVLEIKRSRLMELGIAWPASLGFAPLQASGGALTIDALRRLNAGTIGVTGVSAAINANKTDGDSNTLANPRIRVRNKEKAKVVIGDKVPNITTIITAGTGSGFASEVITYVDVGLTLNVEPTIYLNNEVAIRIALEVSNLVDSITTKSGSVAYRIGTRSASTMLQLKDGENQVLAGLISNEERSSGSKVPGFGSLPILGRLFGSTRDSVDKTEIVLSITPHLIRNIVRPALTDAEFGAGTEASFRRRPDNAVRAPTLLPAAPGARLPAAAPGAGVMVAPLAAPAAEPAPMPTPIQ